MRRNLLWMGLMIGVEVGLLQVLPLHAAFIIGGTAAFIGGASLNRRAQ